MDKRKAKVRGSTASYKTDNGIKCNLTELAEIYSNYGNVPKNVGDLRAGEISHLAKMYLHEVKCRKILERQIEQAKQKAGV
jgi:hypothetical protein